MIRSPEESPRLTHSLFAVATSPLAGSIPTSSGLYPIDLFVRSRRSIECLGDACVKVASVYPPVAADMSTEFLRTPPGLLYLIQLILGITAGFVAQFIWNNGSVYVSLIDGNIGMQTYVYFAVFVTSLATLAVIFMELNQNGSVDAFGKAKILIFHAICGVLLLIAACIESYIVSHWNWWRYPVVMILLWILTISHVAQIAILFFYK
ncbi:hypothetical protein QR680_017105 [Steinernema hermaphroditum]|uniref:Uncharacterized protein n=1 Tax=Steinernema hermaphroditum TaxID=289476 RepID=A0AA39HFH9_9BILA|nr:hypothetical protein QR680_017105 [Steinernema hermaphroditum]